jgi:hypothetical protein
MNKIDEFTNHFHNLNLKYVEMIKWFDPNEFFLEHMLTVGFSNSFIHTVLGEEEDNNLGTPIHIVGDLETVFSTNEFYKHKGKGPNEKSSQSPNVTPKTTTSWSNAPTSHRSTAHQNLSLEIGENDTFDEEESFVLQSTIFDNESKKLIIEKSDLNTKKGKSRSEVNLRNM